jgi:exonuclease VII large subunit
MALAEQATHLNSVSPLATLGRGYSIVRKFNPEEKSYRIIIRSEEVAVGDEVNVLLSKGQLDCIVSESR